MLPGLIRQRAHAGRYRQITRVLLRHGLGGLVTGFGVPLRGRRLGTDGAGPVPPVSAATVSARAVHLRLALEELGPAFIKLGQVFSTRADLLPPEYIAELVKLQDKVPPADFGEVRALIERELGAPLEALFARFDPEPLAAASIGQVHAARLAGGEEVVVKVQRPGVDRIIEEDLAILSVLVGAASRRVAIVRQLDGPGLVAEFAWTLRAELDYQREGRNAERFARTFATDGTVRIPAIHWPLSTARVLTMERLDGVRIDDARGLVAAGHDPRLIARRSAELLLREVLEDGFFHADPHPGNFVVMADGAIGAMDFGMVGAINERLREQLLLLLIAVVERDTRRLADDLIGLGAARSDIDRVALERDIDHLLAHYYGRPLAEIRIDRVVNDVMALVRRNRLRLPAELALLAKTLAMSEAVGRQLDPTCDVMAIAEPFVRQTLRRFYQPSYWRDRLKMRPLEAVLLTAALPGQAQRLLTRLERNQLTFHIQVDELEQTMRSLNGMVNRLALAILAAAMGIGLVFLYGAAGSPVRTWIALVFAAGFAVTTGIAIALLIAIWRSERE